MYCFFPKGGTLIIGPIIVSMEWEKSKYRLSCRINIKVWRYQRLSYYVLIINIQLFGVYCYLSVCVSKKESCVFYYM